MFGQNISRPVSPSNIVKCIDLTKDLIYYHPPSNDYVDPKRKVIVEEPFITIRGKRSKIRQLLEQIDDENATLPKSLFSNSSAEKGLEKAFQRSVCGADFAVCDLAENLNLDVDYVNKWVLLRLNKHHKRALANCSAVTAKMLQFHNKFGTYGSLILKYCIGSVARWAGGSEEETFAGLKYWLDGGKDAIEDELRRIDIIVSDLPTDLKLKEFMGQLLRYTNKTNGNVTEWSKKIMEDLKEEFKLTELEIVRWCHGYKIVHCTKKHGQLTPVNMKMLHFMTYFGAGSLVEAEENLDAVCKWAGGSKEETLASWKYWLNGGEETIGDELRRIDTIVSDLPRDLKLKKFMGQLLKFTNKTNGNVTEWSKKIMEDLKEEFNLTELEIVRWCHAYKIADCTKKLGKLTPVNIKILNFMTYFGADSSAEMEANLKAVCKWAGGSEEEVKASLEMFGRSGESAASELGEKKPEKIHQF